MKIPRKMCAPATPDPAHGPAWLEPARAPRLRQNLPNHLSVHIREPVPSSLEPVDEALVVDAQRVQQRCVEVVDVDRFIDNIEAARYCIR